MAPLQRALWRAFATNSPAIVAAPVSLNHRATFHPFNSFVSPCAFTCQSEKAQNGERRTFRGAHCFSFINANDDTRRAAFSFTRFAIAIRHISNTHLFFRVFFFFTKYVRSFSRETKARFACVHTNHSSGFCKYNSDNDKLECGTVLN